MSKACTLRWHLGGMLEPGSHRTNDRVWISFGRQWELKESSKERCDDGLLL